MSEPDEPSRISSLRDTKAITAARLGIGRTGGSLTTREILDFDLAHARARDAVNQVWDIGRFVVDLKAVSDEIGMAIPCETLRSAAPDRAAYLKRPDLGRKLSRESAEAVAALPRGADLAIIISDGLSAHAAANQAPLVLRHLWPMIVSKGWNIAPLLLVPLARVGISDHVGEILQPSAALILLGERPGLATPESLGAYYTYQPRTGRTDADRNCVSNIHADGLGPSQAADAIMALIEAGFRHKQGGVSLSMRISDTMAAENAIEIDPPNS